MKAELQRTLGATPNTGGTGAGAGANPAANQGT
jgi:hypothetical protein